jgi:hypothetical protein
MSDQRQTRLGFTRASQSTSLNNPQLVLDPPGAPQSEQDPESSPDLTQDETPETSTLATPEPSALPLLPKKRKNNIRTAWVFKYMRDGVEEQHVFYNLAGKREWRCRFCRQNYQLSRGTHAIKRHLNDAHAIFEDSPADIRAKNVQIDIQNAMDTALANPQKRRKLNDSDGGHLPLNGDVLEVLYVKFITACNMPLRLVENPEFRAFVSYLNSDVDTWLNTSHHTIRAWVMRQFEIEKRRIKLRLRDARSKIHISLDIWTSTNNKAVMGVTVVYIGQEGELEHVVLAMKEIEGSHEGENLCLVIISVIDDWDIIEKLGYFIMDNATNNDTMMRVVSRGKPFPPILTVFC